MHMPRPAGLALLLCLTAAAHAGDTPRRYFTLLNTAYDTVVAVDIADVTPDAPSAPTPLPLAAPLHGGGHAQTLQLPVGGCQRLLRMTLADGRTVFYPTVDTCRSSGLRIMPQDLRGRHDR